ncbi:MAG TPA: AAA family ATPase [Nanoarchaeota archaeon]|nr:AAA family ATPase [Nanoarchaeota archaeon]
MKYNILITGPPASGKSTLLQEITNGKNISGIITTELRKDHERWGFVVADVKTERHTIMASTDIKPAVVGKYGVDVFAFEKIAVPAIEAGIKDENSIIIIDEIGNMELLSEKFKMIVEKALGTKRVIGTISMKSRDEFVSKVKSRKDTKIYYLTPINRERVREEILTALD